jgi:hypothetical protein
MIGYICATLATEKNLNCNIMCIQRQDGTYQIHFVSKNYRQHDLNNETVPKETEIEEMSLELYVSGMSLYNQIGCDEIVQ